jgi:hypothetical protein
MHSEYMPTGATINSERYVETLQKLKARVRRVRPDMELLFLHHDNERPHTSAQTTVEIHRLGFTALDHTQCSPDLDTSDFHLFPKLKEHLRGYHFLSGDEVKTPVKMRSRQQYAQIYRDELMKQPARRRKCVGRRADNVEKLWCNITE